MKKHLFVVMFAILSVTFCSVAQITNCSAPIISTSTGSTTLIKDVSKIEITVDEGDLISYTTDGLDPSADIQSAVPSPVVIDMNDRYMQIKAIAVSADKEPSDMSEFIAVAPAEFDPNNPGSKLDNYQIPSERTFTFACSKGWTGYYAGPFMIYAIEELADGGAWLQIRQVNDSDNCYRSIVAQLSDAQLDEYKDLKVGETIDYIRLLAYEEGMRLVTKCTLPLKSNPTDAQPQVVEISEPIAEGYGYLYYRMPLVLEKAQYTVNNGVGYLDNLVVETPFKSVTSDMLVDGHSYKVAGIIGTSAKDSHDKERIFVTAIEEYIDADEVEDLASAFEFEGDTRCVRLNCELTYVTFNRSKDHLFVVDKQGGNMVLTGDFSDCDFEPGHMFNGLTCTLSKAHGVNYGALTDGALVASGKSAAASALEIEVEDIAEHAGEYIVFNSVVGRRYVVIPQSSMSLMSQPQNETMTVGGIAINPSAISDAAAESVGYAGEDNYDGTEFRFKGYVMPDADGNHEFWPIEVKTVEGNDVVTGIEGITVDGDDCQTEYYNLQGVRVAQPEKGIYIVRRGNETFKITVR